MLGVRNGQTGLTNFSYFLVGTLPEVVEKEKNNEHAMRAQEVSLPVVVNGASHSRSTSIASVFKHAKDKSSRQPLRHTTSIAVR